MIIDFFVIFCFAQPDVQASDLNRFPRYEYVELTVSHLENYRSDLYTQRGSAPPRRYFEFEDAINETSRALQPWQTLKEALEAWASHNREYRLVLLRQLKEQIGDSDYWAGQMPMPR